MFNPYFARPIGSRKFEEHLITLMIRNREMVREEAEMLKDGPVEIRPAAHDAQAHRPLERGWYKLDALVRAGQYYTFLEQYLEGTDEIRKKLLAYAKEMVEWDDDGIYMELVRISRSKQCAQSILKKLDRFCGMMLYGADESKAKGCGFN